MEKSCNNCQLRKNERCSQVGDNPCADYLAVPFVSEEERSRWPERMQGAYAPVPPDEYSRTEMLSNADKEKKTKIE